jgi:predicted ABC-type ATPase
MKHDIKNNKFTNKIINEIMNDNKPKQKSDKKIALFICGVPNSGKTTLMKDLIKKYDITNYYVINPDNYLKYKNDYEFIGNLTTNYIEPLVIQEGYNIIYDKVCSYYKNLDLIINKLKENGYYVIFNLLYVPLEIALERNKKRKRVVPETMIRSRYNEITKNGEKYLDLKADEINYYSENTLFFYINKNKNFYYNYN